MKQEVWSSETRTANAFERGGKTYIVDPFTGKEREARQGQCLSMKPTSETSKHRELVKGYCVGNGLDLGSAGDPIVPTAIQVEHPNNYCPFFDDKYPPQLRGDATNLWWFKDGVMDYVYSAHLIEDFTAEQQRIICKEWARVVKPGGHIIILAPEQGRWKEALKRGQPPNNAHKHEPFLGWFTQVFNDMGGWIVLEDRFCDGMDYGMFFVARRKKNEN